MLKSVAKKQHLVTCATTKKMYQKVQRYYGEITVGVKMRSKLDLEQLKSDFGEDCIKIKIVLESPNNKIKVPEVLEVLEVEWEDWESL